jgi:fermentation-respiration switch protein FrsA (DUF1100 family)
MKNHLLQIIVFVIIGTISLLMVLGLYLSRPSNQTVIMPRNFEDIVYEGTYASVLRAEENKICALLMHGIRSNRSSMIKRSIFLQKNGITSLLIDMQAHGETPGNEITFGIKESLDARNGLEYLQKKENCEKVIAIGQSLGGASALLGVGPIEVDALILESVYPTIVDAIKDRIEIRLGRIGRFLAPMLYLQIPLRINASLDELKPIDALKKVYVPVFIISGTNDQHTKIDETKRLYEAANEKKRLWLVNGAEHEDLYSYDPIRYEANILDFIDKSL